MSSQAVLNTGRPSAPRYVEDVIRAAVVLSMFWGVVAFLAGVVIAAQLVWPQLSFDSEYLTFGRLRPLHTSAAIFAFYWIWQDFFQPLIFVSSPKNYTIPMALKIYTDPNSYNNYGGLFAMSVLSLLPVIIVFILFQKYIVEGIATDGIKG